MDYCESNQSYSGNHLEIQCSNSATHSFDSNSNAKLLNNLSFIFETLLGNAKNVLYHQKKRKETNQHRNKKSTIANNGEELPSLLQLIKNLIAIVSIAIFIYILLLVGWNKILNDPNETELVSINFHDDNSTDKWFVLKNLTFISSWTSISNQRKNNTENRNIGPENFDYEIMMNNRQFVKYLFDNIQLWFNDEDD